MGAGAGIIGLWLFSVINHYWDTVRTYARASAGPLILVALAIILLGGLIYYLTFVHEPMKDGLDAFGYVCRRAGTGKGGMSDESI